MSRSVCLDHGLGDPSLVDPALDLAGFPARRLLPIHSRILDQDFEPDAGVALQRSLEPSSQLVGGDRGAHLQTDPLTPLAVEADPDPIVRHLAETEDDGLALRRPDIDSLDL